MSKLKNHWPLISINLYLLIPLILILVINGEDRIFAGIVFLFKYNSDNIQTYGSVSKMKAKPSLDVLLLIINYIFGFSMQTFLMFCFLSYFVSYGRQADIKNTYFTDRHF